MYAFPWRPARKAIERPCMTGPYSWLDDDGFEVTFNPDAGNIAVRGEFLEMTIDDLPDPDQPLFWRIRFEWIIEVRTAGHDVVLHRLPGSLGVSFVEGA